MCERKSVCVCVLECVKERKRDFCFFVFLICFLFVLSAVERENFLPLSAYQFVLSAVSTAMHLAI